MDMEGNAACSSAGLSSLQPMKWSGAGWTKGPHRAWTDRRSKGCSRKCVLEIAAANKFTGPQDVRGRADHREETMYDLAWLSNLRRPKETIRNKKKRRGGEREKKRKSARERERGAAYTYNVFSHLVSDIDLRLSRLCHCFKLPMPCMQSILACVGLM